jgi:transposase InsO family protein
LRERLSVGQNAVAHCAALGVRIERLLTDNGPAYRSRLFAKTCQALDIRHSFTRPYRPQTNGKAERFIQTCLREWAYVAATTTAPNAPRSFSNRAFFFADASTSRPP